MQSSPHSHKSQPRRLNRKTRTPISSLRTTMAGIRSRLSANDMHHATVFYATRSIFTLILHLLPWLTIQLVLPSRHGVPVGEAPSQPTFTAVTKNPRTSEEFLAFNFPHRKTHLASHVNSPFPALPNPCGPSPALHGQPLARPPIIDNSSCLRLEVQPPPELLKIHQQ